MWLSGQGLLVPNVMIWTTKYSRYRENIDSPGVNGTTQSCAIQAGAKPHGMDCSMPTMWLSGQGLLVLNVMIWTAKYSRYRENIDSPGINGTTLM
jgi:hypothetical protein